MLVTNHFDKDGYDEKLRANVKVGTPKVFDRNTITKRPELEDCLNGRDIKDDPFLWGLEDAPNDWENV